MSQINYCGNSNTISTNHNYGYSTRLPYDDSTYLDKLDESVSPLYYRLNPDRIHNCGACLSTLGPRSSYMGYGVSMPVDNEPAVAQSPNMVNIESILSNRNVNKSKNRRNEVNSIDVTKFKLKHPRTCNEYLNPISSRLSNPPASYRDVGINRFYDLNKDIQRVIYWETAANTKLEAIDNFAPEISKIWSVNTTLPHERKSKGKNSCKTVKVCPIGDNSIDYK